MPLPTRLAARSADPVHLRSVMVSTADHDGLQTSVDLWRDDGQSLAASYRHCRDVSGKRSPCAISTEILPAQHLRRLCFLEGCDKPGHKHSDGILRRESRLPIRHPGKWPR